VSVQFNSKHGIPFGASEPWRPPNHAMAKAKDSIGPGFIDLNRLMPQSILERDRAARNQWGDEDLREQILHRSTISANWAMSFESNLLIS